VDLSENGIGLSHLTKCGLTGRFVEIDRDGAHIEVEADLVCAGISAQSEGSAQRGMSGERQFLLNGEDADPCPALAFDRGITGQDKCSFRQIHFAGDGLHFFIVQTAAVWEDGERIALERARSEDVELDEREPARRSHADWIQNARAGGKVFSRRRALVRALVRLTAIPARRNLSPCEFA